MRDQSYGEHAPHMDPSAARATTKYWEMGDDSSASARMLGWVLILLVAVVILAVLVAVALAWPIGGG